LSSSARLISLSIVVVPALVSCELESRTVAPVEPGVVMHAILNPSLPTQTILVERTWDGDAYIWKSGRQYNVVDPISTGGGYGETLAEVDVTSPEGTVVRAIEVRTLRADGLGAGVYSAAIPGSSLQAGGTYSIRVRTTAGEELTSQTVMPAYPTATTVSSITFDRVRDTVRLSWNPVPGARAYQVVIQNVYRSVSLFTDSTGARLTGALRNTQAEGLPHAFLPGFDQVVTINAVDSNYYDYYRATTSSYTGRGIPGKVSGGWGVFGSAGPVIRRQVRVTAPFSDPMDGEYRYYGTPEDSVRTLITRVALFVESHAAKSGAPDAMSGRFSARPAALLPLYSDTAGAWIGRRWKDSVEMAFLSRQRLTDTMDVFRARVYGDTIVGQYVRRVGTWRFVRER
jgi:hypothetical protein